jgi:pre-rRNA-processing protein TSR4
VRGLRGVRVDPAARTAPEAMDVECGGAPEPSVAQAAAERPNLGAALFGVGPSAGPAASAGANPFSTAPAARVSPFALAPAPAAALAAKPAQTPLPQSASALAETFAAKARISPSSPSPPDVATPPAPPPRAQEPWPSPKDQPAPYARFNLDADYETLSAPSAAPIPATATLDDAGEGGGGGGGGNEDKLLFESSMDKVFQAFADRLAHNPEQVLRYEFGGVPLLYSGDDAVGRRLLASTRAALAAAAPAGTGAKGTPAAAALALPRCENCGAARVFEAQLTPQAIAALEEGEEGVEGMEWGTVMLGVCGADCEPRGLEPGRAGYLEEWVGVQWEEVAKNT